jgi:glycosyltransferase involved in cell wall biosynthesis
VFPVYPKGYAGLEVIAGLTAEGLARRGHKVTLFAPEGSEVPGVEVFPTGPPGQHSEHQAYNAYWGKLLEFNDGALIDHSWNKFAYVLKQEGRLTAPVLGVTHAPVNTMFGSPPPVEKPCTVCISEDQRSHYEALFSPQEARTAHNGIDLDYYRAVDVPRTDRFLFLARLSTIKGPDLALKACQEVGVGLDVVGDTTITGEPAFFHQCASLCDGRQLRMVGNVNRGECVWWYSRAHCFLHPNQRFREPLGLAPLEAQACGLPVVAWKYGALKETVVHGETGWLVKSQPELVEAVRAARDGVPSMMREACRENASRFSIDHMVSRYEDLCVEARDTGGW